MAENTKIEWADATVNWWAGCTAVSPACASCYAERMAGRLWGTQWGTGQQRQRFDGAFKTLEALDRKARRLGRPLRVFHNSLSDFFDNEVPESWRIDALSAMEQAPNLIHLLLTKRIGNAQHMIEQALISLGDPATDMMGSWPWRNVWIGATIFNQPEADRDIPKLLAVPAAKRFLSIEPLLGPVDLSRHFLQCCGCPNPGHPGDGWMQPPDPPTCCGHPEPTDIHWVIVGGESGPNARPMHPDWARSLRDQCQAAGVPFFFKQWGEWAEFDPDHLPGVRKVVEGDPEFEAMASQCDAFIRMDGLVVTSMSEVSRSDTPYRGLVRPGKKAAGRLLDGREWNEVPA